MSKTNLGLVKIIEELKQIHKGIDIEEIDNCVVINNSINVKNIKEIVNYVLLLFGKVVIK